MARIPTEIAEEIVMNQIYLIRGQKVMLDRDLAELYGVETKVLKQAVRRNIERFPSDFMFELTSQELQNWRSQFVTSNQDKKGLRYAPFAFTEQGVAMLSSVLNSKQAILTNIQIIRVFTKIRQLLTDHTTIQSELAAVKEILQKVTTKQDNHDKNIELLFQYIDRLQEKTAERPTERKTIGYQFGHKNQ